MCNGTIINLKLIELITKKIESFPIKFINEIFFIPFVQKTNISLFSSYLFKTTNNVKKYVKINKFTKNFWYI